MSKKILLIFLLAFLIRLIALNQSLWLDEAVTAKVVMSFSFKDIFIKFSPTDFHPPLYYLFMKVWTNFFGYSEVALRIPSILFSLATGYVLYLIGGIWAAAFFLFNPLIVYYSQEARMYMMATFLLTVGLYYFLEYQKNNAKLKNIFLMNLFFVLSFYSFYGSIFLIAAVYIYLLYKKQYREVYISYLFFIAPFILISPLIHQQFINARISLTNVINWTSVLGKANLKNLLLIPVKFAIGRIDFYPKAIYYTIAGLWTALVWFSIFKSGIKNKLFLFLLICPLVFGFLISFVTPLLQYFRFLYLISIISILLVKTSRKDIIIVGFCLFSLTYLMFPQFHREDWKNLVKSLPKGKPVYMIVSSSDPVKYYDKNLPINQLTNLQNIKNLGDDIIVIPYTADIYGFDYQKILREKNYQLIDKRSFRGLVLEEYKL